MGDLWYALHFTLDVAKRAYLLLPALLLDPFDLMDVVGWDLELSGLATAVVVGVGLFVACVMAYRDAAEGRSTTLLVRRAISRLRSDSTLLGRTPKFEVSHDWLFRSVRDQLLQPGGLVTGQILAVPLVGPLSPNEWNRALGAFKAAGVLEEEVFTKPGTGKQESRYTLTGVGNEVLELLRRNPPPEPPTFGAAEWSRYRFSRRRLGAWLSKRLVR